MNLLQTQNRIANLYYVIFKKLITLHLIELIVEFDVRQITYLRSIFRIESHIRRPYLKGIRFIYISLYIQYLTQAIIRFQKSKNFLRLEKSWLFIRYITFDISIRNSIKNIRFSFNDTTRDSLLRNIYMITSSLLFFLLYLNKTNRF